MESYNITYGYIDNMKIFRKLEIKRSEFKPFLDDVGAISVFFNKESVDDVICCWLGDNVVGFSKRVGKGLLVFLPCIWGTHDINYLISHMKMLVTALVSYTARIIMEPPSYINQFQFSNEKDLRVKLEKITREEITPFKD